MTIFLYQSLDIIITIVLVYGKKWESWGENVRASVRKTDGHPEDSLMDEDIPP